MKSSRFARRINPRPRGFTLVELVVSMALVTAVGLIAFNVLRSGMLLSSQNVGINVSAMRGREMIDQIGERTRYALAQPTLIDSAGVAASGTTADGLLVKTFIGTPYVVKEAGGTTGDIAETATQFCLEFRSTLPVPSVGDFILLESVSRPELEISAVASMTAVGTTQRRLVTTTAAIGEQVRPAYYRVAGNLYRKEAYVFAQTDATATPRFELRHFYRVKTGTNFSTAANYNVMAAGYRRLSSQAFFTASTSNGADTTTLRAMVNSSSRQETVARGSTVSTYTSIPVQIRLWSLNR